jgi:hypothetical protein
VGVPGEGTPVRVEEEVRELDRGRADERRAVVRARSIERDQRPLGEDERAVDVVVTGCRARVEVELGIPGSFGTSAGLAIPPLAVQVSGIPKPRRRRAPVPAPTIIGDDVVLRSSVPGRSPT